MASSARLESRHNPQTPPEHRTVGIDIVVAAKTIDLGVELEALVVRAKQYFVVRGLHRFLVNVTRRCHMALNGLFSHGSNLHVLITADPLTSEGVDLEFLQWIPPLEGAYSATFCILLGPLHLEAEYVDLLLHQLAGHFYAREYPPKNVQYMEQDIAFHATCFAYIILPEFDRVLGTRSGNTPLE
jgi:hypothetical protein